ncbi:hypothetical protein PIB30_031543 [Stylosanthes scabra]|uniref:Uncharacterized protein n=1 Tax=Stylosanthes scabra TaxID=79078 RepID=A0ABU6QCF2_9FABA|nr:hypothetical protein [Stylosanthes scabra]
MFLCLSVVVLFQSLYPLPPLPTKIPGFLFTNEKKRIYEAMMMRSRNLRKLLNTYIQAVATTAAIFMKSLLALGDAATQGIAHVESQPQYSVEDELEGGARAISSIEEVMNLTNMSSVKHVMLDNELIFTLQPHMKMLLFCFFNNLTHSRKLAAGSWPRLCL